MYNQIIKLYTPYINEDSLRELHHPYNTQLNEAMNQSVCAFAPKGKTFSTTESLDTRVGITGAQNVGYEIYWKEVFDAFGMEYDGCAETFNNMMDIKKIAKHEKGHRLNISLQEEKPYQSAKL